MKLWLLAWSGAYDRTRAVVVRAESETEARGLAKDTDGSGDSHDNYHRTWLVEATCVRLREEGPPGIVLRDHEAG